MKILGVGLLLAALLVLGGFWLIPFGPGNQAFYIQHCVPIREIFRPKQQVLPTYADMCRYRSQHRVIIGAIGAAVCGFAGIYVLLIARTLSGRPLGDNSQSQDPSKQDQS